MLKRIVLEVEFGLGGRGYLSFHLFYLIFQTYFRRDTVRPCEKEDSPFGGILFPCTSEDGKF